MATERTLSIIKPGFTDKETVIEIDAILKDAGLRIVAEKNIKMTRDEATEFYEGINTKPFFQDVIEYMTSANIIVRVLEGENAIDHYRTLMGATDPGEAAEGTIRKLLGRNKQENAVHGSDSPENAKREITLLFDERALVYTSTLTSRPIPGFTS
jgi:nucleoside-diphosphate kinase